MNRRVCVIRFDHYPRESHVRRDAETLRDAGYQVDIICSKQKDQKKFESVDGISVYRISVGRGRGGGIRYIVEYGLFFLLASARMSLLHLRKKYDFIEVDTMPDFLVFAAIVPKILGARVLLYMFENMPELYTLEHNMSVGHPMVRLLKVIEKLSLKFADKIIVTHRVAYKVFARHGLPQSKFVTVLNVPNERVFSPCFREKREKGENCLLLVSHGSILQRYGYQTIIRALKLIDSKTHDVRLLIVGEGEYEQEIKRLVREVELERRVDFTGHVPFDEIPMTIGRADIGIVPMLYSCRYMLPNKLFEYIALGMPTIVSALPAIKAYFDEDCVMFFEPGNEEDLYWCILELYQNPAKRESLVANARRAYAEYRWSKMKRKYLEPYEDLMKGK